MDTKACLQGKRDAVGTSPDTRDVEYYRFVFGCAFGTLSALRVRVLFCPPVGNVAPDTGENGWHCRFFRLPRDGEPRGACRVDNCHGHLFPAHGRESVTDALAAGFIRLGNLANSEIIGVETDLPWAFIFERVDGVPRHPAQIYEALAYFFTFGVNLLLYRRLGLNRGGGVLLGNTLVLVFVARFLIEFIKERQAPFEDQMHLDVGQVLSIPFILLGIFLLVRGLTGWKNRMQ